MKTVSRIRLRNCFRLRVVMACTLLALAAGLCACAARSPDVSVSNGTDTLFLTAGRDGGSLRRGELLQFDFGGTECTAVLAVWEPERSQLDPPSQELTLETPAAQWVLELDNQKDLLCQLTLSGADGIQWRYLFTCLANPAPEVHLIADGAETPMVLRYVRWSKPNWRYEAFQMKQLDMEWLELATATFTAGEPVSLRTVFQEPPLSVSLTCWDLQNQEVCTQSVSEPGLIWESAFRLEEEGYAELTVEYPSTGATRCLVKYVFRLWDGFRRQPPALNATLDGQSARTATGTYQWSWDGGTREDDSVPYGIGRYEYMQNRDSILCTNGVGDISVALRFDAPPESVVAELWPAYWRMPWRYEPLLTVRLTQAADGSWTLPVEVTEAMTARVTAEFDLEIGSGQGCYFFSLDPMPVKPQQQMLQGIPDLPVETEDNAVTLSTALGYWETGNTGRQVCGTGPEKDEDGSMTLYGSGETVVRLDPALLVSGGYFVAYPIDTEEGELLDSGELTMGAEGNWYFRVEVNQPLRVWLSVDYPRNDWVGQPFGGTGDYTLFLQPAS